MNTIDSIPGFFGKLAACGDFVGRRLPPDFVGAWDHWLQRCLRKSGEQLGYAWRDVYLTSPLWRFAIAAGVCSERAWAGVFMPSVDKVGRYFPLTVACAIPQQSVPIGCLRDASTWYDELELLALDLLDVDACVDAFDVKLCTLPFLPVEGAIEIPLPEAPPAARNCLQTGSGAASLLAELIKLGPSISGLWWSTGSLRVRPCVLACEGLPAPASFAAMLDGHWERRGWQLHQVD